jgi:hypothetical protein
MGVAMLWRIIAGEIWDDGGMNRRMFLGAAAGCVGSRLGAGAGLNVAEIDRARVAQAADRYMKEAPVTITASHSERSAGGVHDFFSEGDYWWPDPKAPGGAYVQRDGMTNPDNFVAHRQALMRLSVQGPALCAAWKITRQKKYAEHAAKHLRAWFLEPSTRMNPNLQYAQAIHGRTTGRGVGIIDTIHLVEVVRGISAIEDAQVFGAGERDGIRQWFADYLDWMKMSKNGQEERDAKNNHGTCWLMQAAEFARFTGSKETTEFCRDRYKTQIVPTQIAVDGSMPLELKRTKPYGYSLFNLEAVAAVCQILSTREDNLWKFATADGRGVEKAIAFLFPFIENKKKWPYPADVMYFDQWPVRQVSLLFAGLALDKPQYVGLWRKLNADPVVDETIRNYPLRQPVLWV